MNSDKQAGFSLIEILIVVLIINILAATAITFYIGMRDKARRATIIRTASSASDEVNLWLQSSFSTRRNIIEIDTNFDGVINNGDRTNEELLLYGVAKAYSEARNARGEASPWFPLSMWTFENLLPNGRISVIQVSSTNIRITGRGKIGTILYENHLTVD